MLSTSIVATLHLVLFSVHLSLFNDFPNQTSFFSRCWLSSEVVCNDLFFFTKYIRLTYRIFYDSPTNMRTIFRSHIEFYHNIDLAVLRLYPSHKNSIAFFEMVNLSDDITKQKKVNIRRLKLSILLARCYLCGVFTDVSDLELIYR
jgi:hypothetical protein